VQLHARVRRAGRPHGRHVRRLELEGQPCAADRRAQGDPVGLGGAEQPLAEQRRPLGSGVSSGARSG
jgi:hypothetical protein